MGNFGFFVLEVVVLDKHFRKSDVGSEEVRQRRLFWAAGLPDGQERGGDSFASKCAVLSEEVSRGRCSMYKRFTNCSLQVISGRFE